MGCGASKFDPDEEGAACRFRPLRRRIVEITRRRNEGAIADSTLSTKQLLLGEEDVDSSASRGRKSVSSPVDDIGFVKELAVREVNVKPVSSDDTAEKLGAGKEKERGVGRNVVEREKEMGTDEVAAMGHVSEEEEDGHNEVGEEEEEEEDEDCKTEEEEGGLSDREDCLFCPGSPSFRDYCLINYDNSKDDGNIGDGTKKENKSLKKDGIAPRIANEGSKTQLAKKGRKGRRFRRVLPKGRPAAVKNLLNVTTCYNPSCSNSHDSPRKLGGKAA